MCLLQKKAVSNYDVIELAESNKSVEDETS